MNHARATEWLPELAAGELESELEAELSRHVASCGECQEWLETWSLVAAARPRREAAGWTDHPGAGALARYALGDEAPSEFESERLSRHVKSCAECADTVSVARASVAEVDAADLGAAAGPSFGAWWRANVPRLAVAAGLLIALVVAPLSLRTRPAAEERLAGISLSESRVVEARTSITAVDLKIGGEAEVAFKAGEIVVLGEGFSVGSDAVFSVEIGAPSDNRR